MTIESTDFGQTGNGSSVTKFRCQNANGYSLELIDYGAHITSVVMPDKRGKLANITLGFPEVGGYLKRHPYFGSTVGRFCNRIARGKFSLGDQDYSLATNDAPHHLHGGIAGFDSQLWASEQVAGDDHCGIRFTRTSPDGEEGFPGTVTTSVTYTLNDQNELKMDYTASTDKATPINLTNHAYWNLRGAGSGDILGHVLTIEADKFVAVDDSLIPTGNFSDVTGTPLDFTSACSIGERIHQIDADPVGYDHCYVLRCQDGSLSLAATAVDPESGRTMKVLTTQPGIQLYTGNFLDGSEDGAGYAQHSAFCLETQHYPDSPNQPNFPSAILEPGKTFRQTTVHQFSVE